MAETKEAAMRTKRFNNKKLLSPRWRKLFLTVHVAVSVGAVGADLSVIILGITGLTGGSPELIYASYLAMELLVETALMPLALGALFTGVLLGAGTPWGLTRYYWVLAKLVLTIAALTALVLLLRPKVNQAAAEVLQVPLADLVTEGIGPVAIILAAGPAVAFLILIITAILAIYKPWGKTRPKKRF